MIRKKSITHSSIGMRFSSILLRILPLLTVLFAAACSLSGSFDPSRTSAGRKELIATVRRGDFKHVLRLTGRVNAVESYTIKAPRLARQMSSSMIITKILPTGTRVKKGEILVEFDNQNQLNNIRDREAEYDNLVHQIEKKLADQKAALASDNTELRGAEIDVQTAKVEIRKNDLIPQNQAQINLENLREAEAKLRLLEETFELKRDAEAADLRMMEIQRDRAEKTLNHEKNNVDKMVIHSPMDGLVVLTPMTKGTRTLDPEEGDEISSGRNIMLVVNPDSMEVSAQINQVDVSSVHIGQQAEIHLDAYPDLHFPGRIEHVSAIAKSSSNSNQIRYFSVLVSVQGSDPNLLPDLTAAVDVELDVRENVLLLPKNAVRRQGDRSFVEVLENGGSQAREVQTGPANECEIVIESGLDEGITVALDPELQAHRL
ncbi:MAG: efflux RND transporter periplasmic adaptor subunit [Acidobacteriota bacterium]